jgi:filamentous hemagglutinin family protein
MKQIIQFWLTSGIALCGLLATSPAQAQIASDRTLSTKVKTTDNRNFSITDGNRAGKNLFHSFSEFSVPTGGSVSFKNAADIQNIISRVTGASISKIDGLIQANGAANVFVINPNGIIFGSNAKLSIGGSFLGSTASSLNFADGTKFSATAPQTTPLLTISVPIGLQFGGNPGTLVVQGDGQGLRSGSELMDTTVGLHVAPNQTLALVGGDVALTGATLKTAGGRIELGSVDGSGLVSLTPIDKGWSLGYSGVQSFRDIQLSGAAAVDASGLGGGDIQVQGSQVMLKDGSQIEASTLGSEAGGTLAVTASESVDLSGTVQAANGYVTSLVTTVYEGATGAGGNLTLKTGRLIVRDGAQVTTSTFGLGKGGALSVNASDSVELLGGGGSVQTGLFARTSNAGDAGDLRIATRKLLVQDGAQVTTSTRGLGKAGALSVSASDSVELIGGSPLGPSALSALTINAGAAGELRIATGKLLIADGAVVDASTRGKGNITTKSNAFRGGTININANTFDVANGGQLRTTTSGTGSAGDITLKVLNNVTLEGRGSGIFASTTPGSTGSGGSISIDPNQLKLTDGASVAVYSRGSGRGGNLSIQTGSLTLDNGSSLLATSNSADGGNINLTVPSLLLMRHNSNISANAGSAGGGGNGGNITINTPFLVAVPSENSDITANATTGNGGKVTINASGIEGTQFRQQSMPESDITALSTGGGLNGVVSTNTVQVDPSRGLVTLPVVPVNVTGLIAQGCPADVGPRASRFVITGRGGLPPNPSQPLSSDAVLTNWATLNPRVEHRPSSSDSTKTTSAAPTPIVPATGWVFNRKGEVTLTASAPTVTPDIPWLKPTTCHPQ